jgi:glycosyltransferase involved in cell wall biosynthesis
MRIAFDAKRAFQNNTGLGHYSRTLITALASMYPGHEYLLFTPRHTSLFDTSQFNNISVITPAAIHSKAFPSAWRSKWVTKDLVRENVNLYHGLSHEIPVGIAHTAIPSVVTIHDLIFERFPEQHKKIDRIIYRKKFKYASENADKVIAISAQTKKDLIELYKIPATKIEVCYQSCDPRFEKQVFEHEKSLIRKKYNLPAEYFLYVGSIIERKNLLTICKAMVRLKGVIDMPLVVIGNGGSYKEKVMKFITAHNLSASVIFLNDLEAANSAAFKTSADFPAIYQMATALLYPSLFEGFGIPVLEALWSKTPVITSDSSCMPETGGDGALYHEPYDFETLAEHMRTVAMDPQTSEMMIEKGWIHAHNFTREKTAAQVMKVYKSITA